MCRWLLVLGLVAGGCNKLFDLEHVNGGGGDASGSDGPAADPDAVTDGPDSDAPGCVGSPVVDEDSDGIDDSCDPCPTSTGSNLLDGDGDGLPNACDPEAGPANKILLYASFAQQSDTLAFSLTNATWDVGGRGLIRMMGGGTLMTKAMYAATMVEIRVINATAANNGAELDVTNTGNVQCIVTDNDCSTGIGTCVTIVPGGTGTAHLSTDLSTLQRVELFTTTSPSSCRISAGAAATSINGTVQLTTNSFSVTTNAAATADIRSVVIYGPKP
jgi:hypothetical protein